MSISTASQGVADASRRAIFDAFRTFQQIPKDVTAQSADDAHRLQVLTCSESFREQLRTLAAEIGSVAEVESVRENGVSLDRDYDTVYSIEKSWQICEIFSINPTKLLSIELIKWLKELCYEQPLEIFLAQIQDSDEPENINLQGVGATSYGEFGYWDLVYVFILQGDLESALIALRAHSEISEALVQSDSSRGTRSSASVAVSGNTITRAQCESFFDLLSTHPFANMTKQTSVGISNSEGLLSREALLASTTHTISVEFSAWQNRVRKLRQSNVALLTRIPELDTILRVMAGDVSTLEHLCGVEEEDPESGSWAWGKLTIALLLFVYPPPLAKTDLCRIVEECMQKGSSVLSSSALDKSYITTLREVMTGHVAPTLRSFYHLGVATASAAHAADGTPVSHARVLSAVALLCTAHLSLLLVSGTNNEDLLIPLEKSANEASFFEEIFLESASRLHSLGFPVEVILNYLSVCPLRGKEFARVLLPLVPIASDQSALAVAQTLRESLGLYQEAASLLVARGMWWLRQNPAPPLRSAGPDAREQQLSCSTLAKAAYFFYEADDAARLQVLLESSLGRCMWAVRANEKAFPGLLLTPSACSLYGDALRASRKLHGQDEQAVDANHLLELEAALLEAEELLQAVDVSYLEPSGSSQIASMLCQALRSYVSAVQGRFSTPSAVVLRQSAQELASLVTEPVRGPCIPVRYWLHTLELVAWFANCASGLEGNGSCSSSQAEDQEQDMQVEEGTSGSSSPNGAVFSKAQAYALLSALQEVSSSHGADLLLAEASTRADANVNPTIAQKDQLQVLRLSLLGLLTHSTVHENAVRRGSNEDSNTKRASMVGRGTFGRSVVLNSRSFSKFASATNRFQPQDSDTLKKAMAMEMLSGSSIDFL